MKKRMQTEFFLNHTLVGNQISEKMFGYDLTKHAYIQKLDIRNLLKISIKLIRLKIPWFLSISFASRIFFFLHKSSLLTENNFGRLVHKWLPP